MSEAKNLKKSNKRDSSLVALTQNDNVGADSALIFVRFCDFRARFCGVLK
ncbi:hypothetical protein ACWIUD_00160 [Helicobacter sp. 23-1044]